MHTGYHILLLLTITVLIVVLDEYIRSREGNQNRLETFSNPIPNPDPTVDCSRVALTGSSVNNSASTALICEDGYCQSTGSGGNGCCIDVGATSPVPTCSTINAHYIVSGENGTIINDAEKVCGANNYSLNPLTGKPLCKYDETSKRCQPTQYYPSDPKQPDCHSTSPLNPSGGGIYYGKCRYGPNGPEGANYCNLISDYEKCLAMIKKDSKTGVARGTDGPIACTNPDDEDCIHTADGCMTPYDETPSGFGCYGPDFSSPFEAPLKTLGKKKNACQYNPQ